MYRRLIWKTLISLLASLCLVIVNLGGANAAVVVDGEFDLAIDLKAPQHVEPGSQYVINVSYENVGQTISPDDTWVKVILPSGTEFVSAANLDGLNMPPDVVDGNSLTWLVGAVTLDGCCGHIMITVLVDADLANETLLIVQGEVGSGVVESNLINNVSSVTSAVCDMAGSTKQAQNGKVKPGDVITYTLMIRMAERSGQSDSNRREIELTDVLPPTSQAVFLGWISPTTGTYDGTQLHWRGQIHGGEPVMLQYQLGIKGDVPPGILVTNRAGLAWEGGEMTLDPVSVETYLSENEHMFGPEGGQWQLQYGLTIDMPPNTVKEMTRFEFHELFEGTPPPDAPPGWIFASRAFELKAFQYGEIHQFNQRLTITVQYQGGDVEGLDRNTLRLWFRNGPGDSWAMLGEPEAHHYGQISFTTDHFTEFALFGQGAYRISLPFVNR
jgi:hypothetical protein